MGKRHWLEAVLADAPVVPTERECARLDAFFLHIGAWDDVPLYVEGCKIAIERGGSARAAWSLDNQASGGSSAFLRATWLDASRAIISFGYKEGRGLTDVWKARFSEDDRLEEVVQLASQLGYLDIDRDSALRWWYFGAGVVV